MFKTVNTEILFTGDEPAAPGDDVRGAAEAAGLYLFGTLFLPLLFLAIRTGGPHLCDPGSALTIMAEMNAYITST